MSGWTRSLFGQAKAREDNYGYCEAEKPILALDAAAVDIISTLYGILGIYAL